LVLRDLNSRSCWAGQSILGRGYLVSPGSEKIGDEDSVSIANYLAISAAIGAPYRHAYHHKGLPGSVKRHSTNRAESPYPFRVGGMGERWCKYCCKANDQATRQVFVDVHNSHLFPQLRKNHSADPDRKFSTSTHEKDMKEVIDTFYGVDNTAAFFKECCVSGMHSSV
jgi:hypothetical protein